MKLRKILICAAALIIMHYVDYMLFDKGLYAALYVTAAAGAACGAFCGEKKFMATAVNTVITLAAYAVLVFMTGRLNIYEWIMFPYGMTEENYMSASNRSAAGLVIMLLLGVTAVSLIFGSLVSWVIKCRKDEEAQR